MENKNLNDVVQLSIFKKATVSDLLIPLLDNLNFLTKKRLDYEDWKRVLLIKNKGSRISEADKQIILDIISKMNNNRLSTNIAVKEDE